MLTQQWGRFYNNEGTYTTILLFQIVHCNLCISFVPLLQEAFYVVI